MATERFHNLPEERRRLILNAAMAEFATEGFTKAKLENVAKAAGVTKGLLYYYFEDREDLLGSLFVEVEDRLGPLVGKPPTKPGPEEYWDWVGGVYRTMLEVVGQEPVLMGFLVRTITEVTSGMVPAGFEKHMRKTSAGVRAVVGLGQRCGAVRKDLPEELLQGAVIGVMSACDRWLMTEAQAGRLKGKSAEVVVRLYRSAFSPPQ